MMSASIDHIGIGVPDLAAAKDYYDELVRIVGFREWFPADEHQFNYGPDGSPGTQVFFYRALEPRGYSRHGVGLQHLAFSVPTRAVVEQAHQWAVGRGCEVVHAPRAFPEYGEHTYATYVLDPHGIMLEVACHAPDGAGAERTTVPSGS
jgi:catechol 2,3-dioxygenase-like lactoylglutathione lyase family enzyme